MLDKNEMQALADKQAIRELLYTYCRAVDRLDIPLGQSIWHDDGHADYGADYYQGPGKGVIDKICADQRGGLLSHSHQVTNVIIALDGDRAGSEAYVYGTMRMQAGAKLMQLGVWARYLDRWSRRGGRWGLDRRIVVYDNDEIRDVTPRSDSSRATRDRNDPSYKILAGQT